MARGPQGRSGRGPHSRPRRRGSRKTEGMSVKQTRAEGTRKPGSDLPRTHGSGTCTPGSGGHGGTGANQLGKSHVPVCLPKLGRGSCEFGVLPTWSGQVSPSHCCTNRQPQGNSWYFIPHTSQTSQAAEACGPPPSAPSWGEIRCPLPRPTLLTTPASCSPAEAPPWGPERPDLLLHTWVPLRNTPEDCGLLTFAGAPRGSGQ